jgi:outer membrane protein TolC
MVAYVEEQNRRDALERSANASAEAVRLVRELYRTGLIDFQNVLDTERSLFARQDQLAESRGLVAQNLIGVYRALGGGWTP